MGLRERLERLKATRINPSAIKERVAGAVGPSSRAFARPSSTSDIGVDVDKSQIKYDKKKDKELFKRPDRATRREIRQLSKYHRQQEARRLAEVRVYGHGLSEKERGEYQRVVKQQEKQKQMRQQRAFGSLGMGSTPAPRSRARSYRAPAPARPRQLLGDLGQAGSFLGVGGSAAPQRKSRRKGIGGDLSLGGFI